MPYNSDQEKYLFGVVTTIQAPTQCMQHFGHRWPGDENSLIIVGDSKGPFEYGLQKSWLFDIESQRNSDWNLAKILPEKHYARKNLGYLQAIKNGATTIYETDDDNAPMEHWSVRDISCESQLITGVGWYNAYLDFSKENIWPRGLPLGEILNPSDVKKEDASVVVSPLQQGLANGSPDVDAVWRLILDKDIQFEPGSSIRLGKGLWCPFNSQSTWWWKQAYPLMYLPSYCPFRMTDIWRSFVAQRCLWELGYELVFHSAEVYQERNPHNPMVDFADEVPGYLKNADIRDTLESLELKSGVNTATSNLLSCYEALVGIELVPETELALVKAWIEDLNQLGIA